MNSQKPYTIFEILPTLKKILTTTQIGGVNNNIKINDT